MDKNISEAVELLYKGAKMLAQHCIDCKMPLFKYEGKVICPACKREFRIDGKGYAVPIEKDGRVETVKDENKEITETKKDRKASEVKHDVVETSAKSVECLEYSKVKSISILRSKLFEVISRIESCESVESLHSLINLALKIIELIEKIERI
ncbi:Sjogren's syndrome/scleroderma autoantigen 1 family protein [Archaeoglobus profundus]|nr:Sjogren's syndrome/scleroderma autoantigen 1 family protein [Archaeoglobus profundus]